MSIGVFRGYDSNLNRSEIQPVEERNTNQIAELRACLVALEQAGEVVSDPPREPVRVIVIKSDSEYVVRGITEWLPRWKANGWKNSKGSFVGNVAYFQRIEKMLEFLERDTHIQFWLVPRRMNEMADTLAKAAFEDAEKEDDSAVHYK